LQYCFALDQFGGVMQMDGAGNPPQGPAPDSRSPDFMGRIKAWDSRFSVAKGLTGVTLLTGFLGGYFQYLNSYEEKVSSQAKDDLAAATATFVEISNAFAEMQLLQQLVYFDLRNVLNVKSDASDKAMSTKNARDIFPNYVKARSTLRQNSNILARKAEIYIDWASDLNRDPAAPHRLDSDPLNEALLGRYNFDCDDDAYLPHFEGTKSDTHAANTPQKDVCVPAGKEQADAREKSEDLKKSSVQLCMKDGDGNIVASKPVTISWYSAKHHVQTMHYCFEVAHRTIETARIWASNNDLSDERKTAFQDPKEMEKTKARLDRNVERLDAFMSLAMSQLERIRVKYRPAGFFCHVPLLRDAIGLFSSRCTPIRTAVSGPT
jgi:hypothetical protein